MEAATHFAFEQGIGNGDDCHALMVRHVSLDNSDLCVLRQTRGRVIEGFVIAIAAQAAPVGDLPQIGDGSGWLDHEWSDELLAPGAVGWDWLGINLADGGALTAFQLRRADGSVVWAGGSHRPAGGVVQAFAPDAVALTPLRSWASPATGASYPVEWAIRTPAGSFKLRALFDAQELDSRASTGTVYWEGLAELLGPGGARTGLGYLEMTGRAQPLRLG